MTVQEYDTELAGCRAAAVLPDAPVMVLADRTDLAVVDLDTGDVRIVQVEDDWGVKAVAGLSGDRALVVTIKGVLLYDLSSGITASWSIESAGSVLDVAATADGSVFAVAAGDRLYTGSVGRDGLDSRPLQDCLAVAVSADGSLIAASRGGAAELFRDGEPAGTFDAGHVPILSMGLTPDGTRLAVCDDITETALFDVASGERVPAASAGKAVAMRWNPAGTTCAAIALTRLVGLFDTGGEHLAHLPATEEGGYYLLGGGWTPDGTRVAAGTEHGRVFVWPAPADS